MILTDGLLTKIGMLSKLTSPVRLLSSNLGISHLGLLIDERLVKSKEIVGSSSALSGAMFDSSSMSSSPVMLLMLNGSSGLWFPIKLSLSGLVRVDSILGEFSWTSMDPSEPPKVASNVSKLKGESGGWRGDWISIGGRDTWV